MSQRKAKSNLYTTHADLHKDVGVNLAQISDVIDQQDQDHIEVVSHGKVILCGEHGVVYGAKALGMPIADLTMTVKIVLNLNLVVHQVWLGATDLSAELSPTVAQACQLVGLVDQYFVVHIHSQVPLGAGLGASAALSLSLIKGLHVFADKSLTKQNLVGMANELEQRFHGTPSGLDVNIIAENTLISFQKSSAPIQIQPPKYFHFALVDSGMRSSTKMMCYLAGRTLSDAPQRAAIVQRFNQIHELMIQALKTRSLQLMSSALSACFAQLKELGVVGEVLEAVTTEVIHRGALACKPTGSGGAGYVLALLPHELKPRQQVVAGLQQQFVMVKEFVL